MVNLTRTQKTRVETRVGVGGDGHLTLRRRPRRRRAVLQCLHPHGRSRLGEATPTLAHWHRPPRRRWQRRRAVASVVVVVAAASAVAAVAAAGLAAGPTGSRSCWGSSSKTPHTRLGWLESAAKPVVAVAVAAAVPAAVGSCTRSCQSPVHQSWAVAAETETAGFESRAGSTSEETVETVAAGCVSFFSVPCLASTVPFPMTSPYVGRDVIFS